MDEDVNVTLEDELAAAEIERDVRERPIASALPTGRARALAERVGCLLGWSDGKVDEVMAARADRLDEAARRTEHE